MMHLVDRAIRAGHLDAEVKGLSAAGFIRAVHRDPMVDIGLATMYKPDDDSVKAFAQQLTASFGAMAEDAGSLHSENNLPTILRPDGQLAHALDGYGRFSEATTTAEAVAAGLDALGRALPEGHRLVTESAFWILGANGARGEISAFSDRLLPGFLALSTNNPPIVVAEQLLHESVHIRLWSYIQLLDNEAAAFLRNLPAIYSPFTRSPRSATRVIHGVLSYGAVLAFWDRLPVLAHELKWFDAANESAVLDCIYRRQDVLRARLSDGWMALRQVVDEDQLKKLAEAVALDWAAASALGTFGQFAFDSTLTPATIVTEANLPPIETAEALLAVSGEKVSRLVLAADRLRFLEQLAHCNVAYCLGNEAVLPQSDSSIGGYSNTVDATFDIDVGVPSAHIYVYIADCASKVRSAAELDKANMAGELLGIPKCCQAFFASNWNVVRQGSADLFGFHLVAYPGWQVEGRAECNAAAMYFGSGLCWHFPCSLHCEATALLVRSRHMALQTLAPQLASQLMSGHQGLLLWSSKQGYAHAHGAYDKLSNQLPPSLTWLSGRPFHDRTARPVTVSDWANSPDGDEVRRVLFLN